MAEATTLHVLRGRDVFHTIALWRISRERRKTAVVPTWAGADNNDVIFGRHNYAFDKI